MPKLPKILKREIDASQGLFKIEHLDLEFSNGVRRRYQRLITSGLGAVIIVPMVDPQTVLLIKEYAGGMHRYEVGLPKGRLERGEELLDGANRELKEETGFGAKRLEKLTSLTLAPGYMTHETHIVLARDLYAEKLPGDEPETIETLHWPIGRLAELTARADCTEGRTIAALYIARDYLRQND